MDKFRYVSYAQEVVFAAGSLAQLGELVERLGWKKLLLCANHSMQVMGHVDSIKASLGERLVAVFDQVQPHVQDTQVNQVLKLALHIGVPEIVVAFAAAPERVTAAAEFLGHF